MASEFYGGAEKTNVELANELSKEHDVFMLLLRNTDYLERISTRVKKIELNSHSTRNNPFLHLEIYRNLKKIKPDIVHTHGAKAAILLHRLSRFCSMNHLATKHNSRKGRIFNRLPYISVVSKAGQESVKAGIKQQVRVIYNGIDPLPVEAKKQAKVFTFAAVGRLDKIKGFDLLLDKVATINFPFHLYIAGDGPEKRNLLKKITTLNLNDKVTLLGFEKDVASLMARSHLVVISSHSEGFPQVMVEALFYANVLISTPVGGVVEILPKLFQAPHSELGKKIEEVVNNYADFRAGFQEIKKKWADRLRLSRTVREYEQYYFEIINESSAK